MTPQTLLQATSDSWSVSEVESSLGQTTLQQRQRTQCGCRTTFEGDGVSIIYEFYWKNLYRGYISALKKKI